MKKAQDMEEVREDDGGVQEGTHNGRTTEEAPGMISKKGPLQVDYSGAPAGGGSVGHGGGRSSNVSGLVVGRSQMKEVENEEEGNGVPH